MLAYYPLMAIERDMIGVCMVSAAGDHMIPTYGTEPVFGTHPIAWAAPAGELPPFVFDVATTQIAANKLGERRMAEVLARFGPGRFRAGCASIVDAVSRRMRAGIAAIRDGESRFEDAYF